MLACCFIRHFRELAKELLKDVPHRFITNGGFAQINIGKLAYYLVEKSLVF